MAHYTRSMIRVFRPIPVDQIKLLVFDLDGTLIDSAQDLCNSVNATLKQSRHAPLDDSRYRQFYWGWSPYAGTRALRS